MGQLEDLHLFVAVVDNKSIGKAAEKMHIAKSAVSRRLNLLEERYDIKLINREPGNWQVTSAGRELYQRATGVLTDAQELDFDFKREPFNLSGHLHISIADEFGHFFLMPALLDFQNRYPDIKLSLDFENRYVDLDRENYDLLIRVSKETNTEFGEEKIGTFQHYMYAGTDYASTKTLPENLDELAKHPLLCYSDSRRAKWEFVKNDEPVSIEFQPALNSNSGTFLLQATINGHGISRLPSIIADESENSGQLVKVLADYKIAEQNIHILYSEKRRLSHCMRTFIKEISAACA